MLVLYARPVIRFPAAETVRGEANLLARIAFAGTNPANLVAPAGTVVSKLYRRQQFSF